MVGVGVINQKILKMAGLLLLIAFLSCCSTVGALYIEDIYNGKQMLRTRQYDKALDYFIHATRLHPDAAAYAYAATAAFKLKDFQNAALYLNEAERLNGRGSVYLRIKGYKALIALRNGTTREGLNALSDYIDVYQSSEPRISIEDIKKMWRSQDIDYPALERIIEEQITAYETDIEDFEKGGTDWRRHKLNPFSSD